jgi:hypothetical protein
MPAEDEVVDERIVARCLHVGISTQIPCRIEMRPQVGGVRHIQSGEGLVESILANRVEQIVDEGTHIRRGQIGIGLQIPCCPERRRGIDTVPPSDLRVMVDNSVEIGETLASLRRIV